MRNIGSVKIMSAATTTISNITYEKLPVKNVGKRFEHLLPKNLTPEVVSFTLNNTRTAVANALRKVFIEELNVKNLHMTPQNIKTNDPFLDTMDLIIHITCIPIVQTIPITTKFALKVANNTDSPKMVYSRDIQEVVGKTLKPSSAFNETHQLHVLSPHTSLEINGITVEESNAIAQKNSPGLYSICSGFTYRVSSDDSVSDTLSKIKDSVKLVGDAPSRFSALSTPTKFDMSFRTNGNINISTVISLCCNNIIDRLNKVIDGIDILLINRGDRYTVDIENETDTLGQVIQSFALDEKPIGRISYTAPLETPILHITIIPMEDVDVTEVKKVILSACHRAVKEFGFI